MTTLKFDIIQVLEAEGLAADAVTITSVRIEDGQSNAASGGRSWRNSATKALVVILSLRGSSRSMLRHE